MFTFFSIDIDKAIKCMVFLHAFMVHGQQCHTKLTEIGSHILHTQLLHVASPLCFSDNCAFSISYYTYHYAYR